MASVWMLRVGRRRRCMSLVAAPVRSMAVLLCLPTSPFMPSSPPLFPGPSLHRSPGHLAVARGEECGLAWWPCWQVTRSAAALRGAVVARGTGVWQRCSSGAAPTTLLCNGNTPSSSPTALLQACSVVGNQGRKGLGNYNKQGNYSLHWLGTRNTSM